MLNGIVRFSLHFRVLVVAAAIVLLIAGARTARKMPLDVFPEFAPPRVEIQTEAPGLSTEEVESFISVPLESALNGVPRLKTIRSKSVLGLSSIVLFFEEGTDLHRARQLVQERLAIEAARLPKQSAQPVMLAPLSSTSRVLKIGMSSDTLSQMDMTILARWTVRPRLMAVAGVANVAIWGQRDRQLQVLVNPARLRLLGVTLDEVIRAAGDAVVVGAGGFVDTPNQRLAVRQLTEIQTPADLARNIVAFRNGVPLRLGDVADIVEGHPAPIGDAVINDGPGILLIVEKHPDGNTLDVTKNVEAALADLAPALSGIEIDSTIFRPATFIEMSLHNLSRALTLGCILVVIVLVAFLADWRTALISAVAIPLSLLAAALVLYWLGVTINVMTLAGLVIAVGEVVDDAIIDVENISRRLRLNALAGFPKSAFRVVLDASLEVRSAVVYATFIVILVFVPVFFLQGLAGTFFRPLGLAYILAILASLGVALTITPAMCLLLLPRGGQRHEDSMLTSVLKRLYRGMLVPVIRAPGLALLFVVISFVGSGVLLARLGEEFLPSFQETDFLMHWVEKPGTSLDAMTRITIPVSRELRAIPGVRNFGAHIGRAEVADEVVGPNFTELWISIEPDVPYQETIAKIQEVVDGYPGLYRDVLTYLKERIKEVLTGTSASIVVRTFGDDLETLRTQARKIEAAMADIPGITTLKVEPQVLVPQIQIAVRPDDAAGFGLSAGAIRRTATTMIQGTKVGELFEDQKIFDVVVWGEAQWRNDPSSIRDLLINTPGGGQVPLADVANIYIDPAPNEIKREAASRRIDVTCNLQAGADLGNVAREVEARVRKLDFPRGYHPEFLGEYTARTESRNRLLLLSGFALFGIFLLLQADFRSFGLATIVFLTLPFALIGGVIGAWLSGGVISLGSLVGFVAVLGIAARNGIMLVSHYRHLLLEGMTFGRDLILRGAEERLSPILMTALSAGLGLLPLVMAGNKPGHEIEFPLAVVILGGLVSSTILNLLVLPSLVLRFGARFLRVDADEEYAPDSSITVS